MSEIKQNGRKHNEIGDRNHVTIEESSRLEGEVRTHTVDPLQHRPMLTEDIPIAPPAWVAKCSTFAPEWKRVIAGYAATHLIKYGDVIQMGSGTSFNSLMDKIVERQSASKEVLDLIILTTNLQVLAKGREAQVRDPRIFNTMQIILTGGAFQTSLDSLTGEYAAKGVQTDFIHPDTVFFGAAGLSFRDGLRITYHFGEEISTQIAHATRATGHRVLLCDHTKLGRKAGYNAELTIESLLSNATKCTIISSLPDILSHPGNEVEDVEAVEAVRRIEQEEQQFISLMEPLATDSRYADKELALRLIGKDGTVSRECSLSAIRRRRSAGDGDARIASTSEMPLAVPHVLSNQQQGRSRAV